MGQGIAGRTGRRVAVMAAVVAVVLFTATSLPASAASVGGRTAVTTEASAYEPSVASDGTDFLVVWTQNVSNVLEVFAAQVSGNGSIVESVGALSTTGDNKNDFRPSVAWNGSKYLITWEHEFSSTDIDLQGRLVTRAGFPLGGVRTISTPTANQRAPSVTALGSTFLVVWSDDRNGGLDIFRGRVSTDGTRLDGDGVAVTSGSPVDFAPDVAANGSGYLVTFPRQSGTTDLYGQRLNASAGTVGSTFPIATTADVEDAPTVASNGSDYLVVWGQLNGGDVLGAQVSSTGSVFGPVTVSTAPSTQSLPDVTFNGAYLVAWRDDRDGGYNAAYATRVASDGTVQDPNGFLVDAGPGPGGGVGLVGGPAVAPAPGANKWAVTLDLFGGGGIVQRIASK